MFNKTAFYLVSIFVLILISDRSAFACSCPPPLYGEPLADQVKKEKKQSDAVFTGKVLKIIENHEDEYTSVELQVIDLWKGRLTENVTVLTGLHDGNCRFPFSVDKTYLVYARNLSMYSRAKSLSTHICFRTALLADATADIHSLGKRAKPRKN